MLQADYDDDLVQAILTAFDLSAASVAHRQYVASHVQDRTEVPALPASMACPSACAKDIATRQCPALVPLCLAKATEGATDAQRVLFLSRVAVHLLAMFSTSATTLTAAEVTEEANAYADRMFCAARMGSVAPVVSHIDKQMVRINRSVARRRRKGMTGRRATLYAVNTALSDAVDKLRFSYSQAAS